jgi:transcriptional regulator with XRE-family HTH domain
VKLGQLIATRKEALGEQWPQMIERAERHGYSITRQYLSRIAHNDIKVLPGVETMRAIAAACDVSADAVYQAAGESVGFALQGPYDVDDHTRAWLVMTEHRSEREKRALVAAVEAHARMLDLYRQGSGTVTEPDSSQGQVGE